MLRSPFWVPPISGLFRSVTFKRLYLWLLGIVILWFANPAGAIAASIDPYVLRYLDVAEPVELPMDAQQTRSFTGVDLSQGKRFFEENCVNCHVGGTTLPNPSDPLSLEALKGAIPPRDTISSLVAFIRHPMTYDRQEDSYWCREVPESWLSDPEVENLAAFILRASQKAPGWGTGEF